MSKLIHITILVVLLLGFVAIQAANITEPTVLTTVENGQAVQIGRIWVPAEQSVLDAAYVETDYDAPQALQIGRIWIPAEQFALDSMLEAQNFNTPLPVYVGRLTIP